MEAIEFFAFGLGNDNTLRNAAIAWIGLISALVILSVSFGIYWIVNSQKKGKSKKPRGRDKYGLISGIVAILVGIVLVLMVLPTVFGGRSVFGVRLSMNSLIYAMGSLALVVGVVDIILKRSLSYGNAILTCVGLAVIAIALKISVFGL